MSGGRILVIAMVAAGCQQIFGIEPPVHGDSGTTCQWRSLAAGIGHTCGVDPAGHVVCWGGNWFGQVQPGGPVRVLEPVQVTLPGPAVQIAAGKETTCARLDNGSAWCWGDNSSGQLGAGTSDFTDSVVRVMLGDDRIVDLGIGGRHACARRESDNAILCWGDNQYHQLGTTAVTGSAVPILVPGTAGATSLAVGHRHTCAVIGGTLTCWGRNQRSQASGQPAGMVSTPRIVPLSGTVIQASAAGAHTCAVDTDGLVTCWGAGENGQLGLGEQQTRVTPAGPAITDGVEVRTMNFGACALGRSGVLSCWGIAAFADGRSGTALSPVALPFDDVTTFTTGNYHACAVTGGALQCWGSNGSGQLGRGTISQTATPAMVPVPITPTLLTSGSYFSCASANNALYCWGDNGYGELGDGTTLDVDSPTQVALGQPAITGIAAGHQHLCVWGGGIGTCVGANYYGQIGNGLAAQRQFAPVRTPVSNIAEMSAGLDHTCAISGNSVYCWGRNADGQLGSGSTTDSYTPVMASGTGPGTPNHLAAGWGFTCVLLNGGVRCWGDNAHGQLGDGTFNDRLTSYSVSVPGTVVNLDTGRSHACAVNSAGELYCWGQNSNGELGQGDRLDRTTPTKVGVPPAVVGLAMSDRTTCAQLTGGAVYCWGWGYGGELADGNFDATLTPSLIPALGGATTIAMGSGGGCAIINNGTVLCWGDESYLGDGNVATATAMPTMAQCTN